MRLVLVASLLVACGGEDVHAVGDCDSSWSVNGQRVPFKCELGCETKPYNQDGQPDTGSGSPPEMCLAGNPSFPTSCARVSYPKPGDIQYRGCCQLGGELMRFWECN